MKFCEPINFTGANIQLSCVMVTLGGQQNIIDQQTLRSFAITWLTTTQLKGNSGYSPWTNKSWDTKVAIFEEAVWA